MSDLFRRELEVALQAVRVASRACRSVQSSISPETIAKQDKSPVTVADFASQAIVCKIIGDAFPQDAIVGEEDSAELRTEGHTSQLQRVHAEVSQVGLEGSPDDICRWIDRGNSPGGVSRFWTLDPIDGTKGFLRGEQYAVSLALIVDGQIEVSVLGCPNLPAADAWDKEVGALFSAVRGHGAQLRKLDDEQAPPQVVRVSGTARGSMPGSASQSSPAIMPRMSPARSGRFWEATPHPAASTVRPSTVSWPAVRRTSICVCRQRRPTTKRSGTTRAAC